MRYAAALLFVLSWIPVQAQEVDNIGRLANALSVQTECTWLPNEDGDYIFYCGDYHDYDIFKMQISTFLMKYSDIDQTIGWTAIDKNEYAMALVYEGEQYGVIYLAESRYFAIVKMEE